MKNSSRLRDARGFSLLEVMVVIAIIALLSSVLLAAWNSAKEKAQDARRITELKQLKIAVELYRTDHGHYPRESEGANGKIGEGSGLDAMLAPYMTAIPSDPAGPGNPDYYYYYDGNATCGGSPNIAVVFAVNMQQQTGNGSQFCTVWGGEGGSGTPNAYHVVLGTTD
jgi:general secretion pathway protein G